MVILMDTERQATLRSQVLSILVDLEDKLMDAGLTFEATILSNAHQSIWEEGRERNDDGGFHT